MRKRLSIALAVLLAACNHFTHPDVQQSNTSNERWAIYYDKSVAASTFKDYDLVVFDRFRHPDFKSLKHHTTVLAYVSVGEVNQDVPEIKILQEANALVGEKTIWSSYHIDISQQAWIDFVMAQVGDAQKHGFDGVMLDTLDGPVAAQEKTSDREWAEAREISLIQDIHAQFPHMKIMLNRGFSILPRVAGVIDYELAESTLADTDVSTGQSRFFPPKSYQFALNKLAAARDVAPGLKIYTLDYWNLDDVEGLHKIYAIQRAQGFSPYVSTPDLRRYTPEPVELNAKAKSMKGGSDA